MTEEWRLPTDVYYADPEFYKDLPLADHQNEFVHGQRLIDTAHLANRIIAEYGLASVIDYGCGNGGLLTYIQAAGHIEDVTVKGYDMLPANVQHAQTLSRPVEFQNFLELEELEYCDMAIMSETLEHLEDPHSFVKKLRCHWFIATVPHGETPESHYPHHLWAWTMQGFDNMMADAGFVCEEHFVGGKNTTQIHAFPCLL